MTGQEGRAGELAKVIWRSCGRVRMPDARIIAEAVLAAGYERRRDECLDPYGRPLFDESVAEADEIRKQVRG